MRCLFIFGAFSKYYLERKKKGGGGKLNPFYHECPNFVV
jgi:hypothetical protein